MQPTEIKQEVYIYTFYACASVKLADICVYVHNLKLIDNFLAQIKRN